MSTTTLRFRPTRTKSRERRRSERVKLEMVSWVTDPSVADRHSKYEVKSINLSRHGVGFYSQMALPAGHMYVIEVGLGSQQLVSKITITSCRRIAGKGYEIGAEFQ